MLGHKSPWSFLDWATEQGLLYRFIIMVSLVMRTFHLLLLEPDNFMKRKIFFIALFAAIFSSASIAQEKSGARVSSLGLKVADTKSKQLPVPNSTSVQP